VDSRRRRGPRRPWRRRQRATWRAPSVSWRVFQFVFRYFVSGALPSNPKSSPHRIQQPQNTTASVVITYAQTTDRRCVGRMARRCPEVRSGK
jgi:hypothetical protein